MALLAYQNPKPSGVALNFTSAAGGGDTIKPEENGVLLVRNGDGTATTVTVVVPGDDKYGQARPDLTFSVAAAATAAFGPLPVDLGDVSDDLIDITYSKVTSLTVAAVRI
jgi:hypothetical protein